MYFQFSILAFTGFGAFYGMIPNVPACIAPDMHPSPYNSIVREAEG